MADERDELRLKGVSKSLKAEIRNISKNSGVTMSGFLKTKIREIVESYPPHMRRPIQIP